MPLTFTSDLDDSAFTAALKHMGTSASAAAGKISSSFSSVAAGLGPLGVALSGGAIIAGIKGVADFAGSLQDSSDALGIGVEQMQGFSGAMAETGVSGEKFSKGMSRLTQSIQDARDGNKGAIQDFERLGVTLRNLEEDDPSEILLKMAEGLKNSTDSTESFAAAMGVLGKGGAGMVASLKQGRDAFQEQADAVKKLSAQEVADLDAAGDAWTRFGNKAKVAAGGVLASVQTAFQGKGFYENVTDAIFGSKIIDKGTTAEQGQALRDAVEERKKFNRSEEGINKALGVKGQGAAELAAIDEHNSKVEKSTREANEGLQQAIRDDEDRALKEKEKAFEETNKQIMQDEKEGFQFLENFKKEEREKDAKAALAITKKRLDDQLEIEQKAGQEAKQKLGDAMQEMRDFNRASPDERRQMNRDQRDEDRALAREGRMQGKQDARAGAGRRLGAIDAANQALDMSDASIAKLAAAIAAENDKLVLAQN